MVFSWLCRRPQPRRRFTPRPVRPRLESLEDRLVPSATQWTNFFPNDGNTYGTAQINSLVEDPTSPPGAAAGYVYAGGYTTPQGSSTTTGFALAIAPDGTQTTIFSLQNVKIYSVSASADAVFVVGEDDSSGTPQALIDMIPKSPRGSEQVSFGTPVAIQAMSVSGPCMFDTSDFANGALYTGGCCVEGGQEHAIVCETTFGPGGPSTNCEDVNPPGCSSSCVTRLHVAGSHIDVIGNDICNGMKGSFVECIGSQIPPPNSPGPQPLVVQVSNVDLNSLVIQPVTTDQWNIIVVGTTEHNLYVAKYTVSQGEITKIWDHTYTNADGKITGNDVTLDADGNIYVVGTIDLNLGGTTVADGYLMRLSSDGNAVEGLQYIGNQDDPQNTRPTTALAIIPYYADPADKSGSNPDLVVAGWTASSVFDGDLESTGGKAGFSQRWNQDPNSGGALPPPADGLITIS
jgi:hypothetical protein